MSKLNPTKYNEGWQAFEEGQASECPENWEGSLRVSWFKGYYDARSYYHLGLDFRPKKEYKK